MKAYPAAVWNGITLAQEIDGKEPTPTPATCPACERETLAPIPRTHARTCEHCGFDFTPGREAKAAETAGGITSNSVALIAVCKENTDGNP